MLSASSSVGGFRRRRIRNTALSDLTGHAVALEEHCSAALPGEQLHLFPGDDASIEALSRSVATAETASVLANAVVYHTSTESLGAWRRSGEQTRTAFDTRLGSQQGAFERLCSDLASIECWGVRLHHQEWTAGFVAMAQRFGLRTLAWGAEHEREMVRLFNWGLDVVSSEHHERLAEAIASHRVDRTL